jgi:clan AA aspartic protease
MITGRVRNLEAIVEFEVAGPSGQRQPVEAVIDTGYNGHLTLPSELVSRLGLPFAGHRRGKLADGSVTILDVHLASIVWHGLERDVLVLQAAGGALVGMALLEGCRLTVEVFEDGTVTVE